MKNDLTQFEKKLLRVINLNEKKKFTHKNLMEWSNSKATVEKNLQPGEKIYEAMGCFVAIKE